MSLAHRLSALPRHGVDSRQALLRLLASVLVATVGGSGMYIVIVVLPTVQAEFGTARAGASLPFTLTMIGYAIGGVLMGRIGDRFGVAWSVALGAVFLALGLVVASFTQDIGSFGLVHGALVAMLGSSACFGPLVADTALWFEKRRGIAVAVCASGNYLAGAVWPPVVQALVEQLGWRTTYQWVALVCLVTLLPLALALRRRAPLPAVAAALTPAGAATPTSAAASAFTRPLGLSPAALQGLLVVAGVGCCVAMSMPQVHIVAYCADLGFGPARGAQMLSLMLACGVVSRLVSGVVSDRIGGLRTLIIGSLLQGLALLMFLPASGLVPLFVVSALFGLFQGGIVPSYAIIVRENFPAHETGTRVGVVLMATLLGMAFGGWISGWIFDLTGSYTAAFVHGFAWNLLNLAIAVTLLMRQRRHPGVANAARAQAA